MKAGKMLRAEIKISNDEILRCEGQNLMDLVCYNIASQFTRQLMREVVINCQIDSAAGGRTYSADLYVANSVKAFYDGINEMVNEKLKEMLG